MRFSSFGCILEQFCYCTKLGAKRAKLVQLMQKFVQRCLVRIFCNECSRSTPLDPKLMFWCVSFRLGAFGTVSLLHKTCCKNTPNWCNECKSLGHDVLLESFATNAPNLHYWTLNSCFRVFLSVRVLFGPFRYCTKLGAINTFMPRCRAKIFRNERSQSTPLDSKHMF